MANLFLPQCFLDLYQRSLIIFMQHVLTKFTFCTKNNHADGEATGGSCYCAIAALRLMNRLDALSAETLQDLVQWCEARYLTCM